MQWRQVFFSFAILFGATLWALPFSVSAVASTFDFCVANSDAKSTACPGVSTFKTVCSVSGKDCVSPPAQVGGMFEHCCTSFVDPCIQSSGFQCLSSCRTGDFRANSCDRLCTDPGTKACVAESTFFIAAAAEGGALKCGAGDAGFCKPTCTASSETEEATKNSMCLNQGMKCCKSTGAITTAPAPDCTVNPTASGCATTTIKNPLAFSTVEGILGSLLGALQGIIVVLALISIVIGGILYITSAGNDERMKTAKGAITAAAIGLALGLAAPSFLKQIGAILGWGPVAPTVDCPATLPAADLATCQAAQTALNAAKPLSAIVLSVLQFLLSIVGVLGIIMLVIGGLTYLTSAGNEERSESGKKIVMYAIIGIGIALASLIIVTQVAGLFAPAP